MSQDQIVQFFHILLHQVTLDGSAFGVISRIDQHRVTAAGDQGGISLPHIDEMDFHGFGPGSLYCDGRGR